MTVSAEALWKLLEVELLAAYHDARRQYVERKFARDTQRARLEWLKAKAFISGLGGVTERKNAVDASEEFGRKGQQIREMTRDLDLLKADVDLIAMIVRLRGVSMGATSRLMARAKETSWSAAFSGEWNTEHPHGNEREIGMKRYDPLEAPDPKVWLSLDEQRRISLAHDYHRRARVRLPGVKAHAVVHVIVENQIAMGDELRFGGRCNDSWRRASIGMRPSTPSVSSSRSLSTIS